VRVLGEGLLDPQIHINLAFGSDTFRADTLFRAVSNGLRYP